jgi:hypothetical protein
MNSLASGSLSRRAFARLTLGGLVVAAVPAGAASPSLLATMPQRRLVFEVRGLGRVIGSHEVSAEGTPAAFIVQSDVDIDVRVLGLSVFTYRHTGTETWKNDRLVAFTSTSTGDERTESVVGRATSEGFEVKGRKGVIVAPPDIMVGSYWTPRIMSRHVLLDPQKGVLEEQVILDRERATWPVGNTTEQVTRYRISSILNGEVAYDEAGRWVGAKFKKKGTEIEYRLRT